MADNDIRRECILELFQNLRPVVSKRLLDIWESIHTSKEIPQRYWLKKFQLALKNTLQIEPKELRQGISHVQELAATLYKAYVLTGEVYHEEAPQVKESVELLLDFTKEVIVSTARQLWYSPYLTFFITHEKSKAAEGRSKLDSLIKECIKTTLKQQTGEMIVAQRAVVEKYKNHVGDVEDEESSEDVDSLTDESYSTMDSSVTDKSESRPPRSQPPKSPKHIVDDDLKQLIPYSPPKSPKYIVGEDLKLSISGHSSPRRSPSSIASSATSRHSLKALPTEDDDINDIYIPRKSNPASLSIPLMNKNKFKAKEHLYNMSWYRGNPKLYQYLVAKKKRQLRDSTI
jgi:hypothetical protein